MGTSCVNFHARNEDPAAVAKALAQIVHVEALIAPPSNGWITFFDQNASSQDTKQLLRIGRSLSKKLQTAVFAFLVHDSDVFRYHLFERGKLIDQFDSRRDCFDIQSNARLRKCAGHPEQLLGWTRPGVTIEDIQDVLSDTSKIQSEEERAAAFAILFDIDPALAAADFQDIDVNREGFHSVVSKASPLAKALADAVAGKDVKAVRAVLASGASPNIMYGYEFLLDTAIRNEDLELVQVLREFGAKSEHILEDGTRLEGSLSLAISQAAHSGRREILEFLLTEAVPPTAAALADGLCEAVRRGSLDIVDRLIKAGANVNLVGPAGSLALVHAVKRGYSRVSAQSSQTGAPTDWDRMVQTLLNAGADVNGRQRNGVTPLMSAAWNNELDFVRKLLALGADPNARLDSGLTALLVARSGGYQDVVEALSRVTEVPRAESPGSLWAAATAGDLAGVDNALAAGVSPDAMAGVDLNPLLAAAMNKHCPVVARLLRAGANPNVSTKYNGLTPLWYAQVSQDEPMITLLIEAGAINPHERRRARPPGATKRPPR